MSASAAAAAAAASTATAADALKKLEKERADLRPRAHAIVHGELLALAEEVGELLKSDGFSLTQVAEGGAVLAGADAAQAALKEARSQASATSVLMHRGKLSDAPEGPGAALEKAVEEGRQTKFPQNAHLQEQGRLLRNIVLKTLEALEVLDQWIALNSPKMEAGGNYGVDVQEQAAGWVSSAASNCENMLASYAEYSVVRSQSLRKFRDPGYNGIEDVDTYIHEIDTQRFFALRKWGLYLRNSNVVLCDSLLKNFDYVESPKGDTSSSAHMAMF